MLVAHIDRLAGLANYLGHDVLTEPRATVPVPIKDADDLQVPYTRLMTAALLYPQNIGRILMVGLGGGSISTYLGRAMPHVQIDVVELDPGVIAAGHRYFGLLETTSCISSKATAASISIATRIFMTSSCSTPIASSACRSIS
jgi:precorrin-6B methylase 2